MVTGQHHGCIIRTVYWHPSGSFDAYGKNMFSGSTSTFWAYRAITLNSLSSWTSLKYTHSRWTVHVDSYERHEMNLLIWLFESYIWPTGSNSKMSGFEGFSVWQSHEEAEKFWWDLKVEEWPSSRCITNGRKCEHYVYYFEWGRY